MPARARRTIVLHGEQVALQVHESIGHALELDRILLGEASYAGTSWVGARRPRLAALRLRAAARHRRRDAARRPGLVRLGRRGRRRARAPTSSRAACCAPRCRTASRAAAHRPRRARGGCARADGFARQPIVRMTNVSLEPGDAGTLDDLIADTDDGPVPGDQPLVVDRRPPPAVPVRHRGRAARSAAASSGRLYRNGSYAGVTPQFWGSLDAVCAARRVAAVGADQLRQGRARAGHGGLARRRAGALSRRAGRRGVSAPRRRSSWPSARWRFADGEAQVTVDARALAAVALRASRADAGHRASTTSRVAILARARRPHRLGRRPTRRPTTRCAPRAPRAPRPPARAAAAAAGAPGDYPGPPRTRGRRAAARRATTPATAQLDPASPAARCATAFAALRERGAGGVRASGPRARVDTAIASTTGVRATDA